MSPSAVNTLGACSITSLYVGKTSTTAFPLRDAREMRERDWKSRGLRTSSKSSAGRTSSEPSDGQDTSRRIPEGRAWGMFRIIPWRSSSMVQVSFEMSASEAAGWDAIISGEASHEAG